MSSSTVEHFSHPEHPLVLKEDVVIGTDATCSVCDNPVIGYPTYTCSRDCQNFYLHKTCAELPKQIIREKQDLHPLTLLLRPDTCFCDVCTSQVNFFYACDDCCIDLCVDCAFPRLYEEHRLLHHVGHLEHTLTMQRQALFKCNACYEEAKDYSYVCIPCDFWMHKKCAFSPLIIPAPTYHHHPLDLIFSIPVEHRYFNRGCAICKEIVYSLCWSYYCHKCTFFVHLKCSTSTITLVNEIEENGIIDDEPDLLQFPLPEEESLFDLIITQCSKLFQGKGENSSDDPQIIEEHWSHSDHSLELHQLIVTATDDSEEDNNNNDDGRLLICDGCVQPITVCHPSYYACIQCDFYLHSFCANKLPLELPVEVFPFHTQHPLILNKMSKFYSMVTCGICGYRGNGFFYECQTCDIKIDIRCAFLPTRIRHKFHKQHPLVQRPFSNSRCSVSNLLTSQGVEYACETCNTFRARILCAFYPSRLKHKYDDHSIILKYPLFFHEGVIYCQICEEQLDNQYLLYNCDECDQPFHFGCIRSYESVKLGGTIRHIIGNQPHTLALVLKRTPRRDSPLYICGICGDGYYFAYFFECAGCGYLACIFCIQKIY